MHRESAVTSKLVIVLWLCASFSSYLAEDLFVKLLFSQVSSATRGMGELGLGGLDFSSVLNNPALMNMVRLA